MRREDEKQGRHSCAVWLQGIGPCRVVRLPPSVSRPHFSFFPRSPNNTLTQLLTKGAMKGQCRLCMFWNLLQSFLSGTESLKRWSILPLHLHALHKVPAVWVLSNISCQLGLIYHLLTRCTSSLCSALCFIYWPIEAFGTHKLKRGVAGLWLRCCVHAHKEGGPQ